MRTVLIIIFVLLIAVLGLPYWFGMKAENEYNNIIETVSKFENLEIVSKSYKRGWLKSLAEITFSIKEGKENTIQIIERDTIYHGPLPVGLLSKGTLDPKPVMAVIETKAEITTDTEEEYAGLINSLPPLNFETSLALSGHGTTVVSIQSVYKKLQDGKTLKWSGLNGVINFTPDLTEVISDINSSNIEIEDDTFRVYISGIDINSNLNYPASNYTNPLGDVEVKIEEFSSEGKEEGELNKVTLTNLQFTGSTNQNGNLFNHTHSLGFETLIVSGNSYGPGIYELELRNINKGAFEEIQKELNKDQSTQEPATASEALWAQIMKSLPQLLEGSPEIELTKLNIETGDGELQGHALISANGNDLDNPELAANPIFLLAAVTAEVKLSVSKPLLENVLKDYKIEEITDEKKSRNEELPGDKELQDLGKAKAQSEIKQMVDQNILILKDGNYVIEAAYKLGQITLNGNPLNLNSLLNL
jgi:uncharacterized protein YdgA (DUF945 family)